MLLPELPYKKSARCGLERPPNHDQTGIKIDFQLITPPKQIISIMACEFVMEELRRRVAMAP